VAFLLACIWALLILAALLYLGMLEQRFGVDILRDGGAYDQLFLLRGPRTLAAALAQSLSAQLAAVDTDEILRQLQALTATALEQGTALVDQVVVLAQRISK
jgi:protein required for attachment to host cells